MSNPQRFFQDHPLPWEVSRTSAGTAIEDANHEVMWRFDHFDTATPDAFVQAINAVGEREPLRLKVEPDGSISRIAGGPLQEAVSTSPTDCPHGIDMFQCDEHGWPV